MSERALQERGLPSARMPNLELATRRQMPGVFFSTFGLVGNFHVFDAAVGPIWPYGSVVWASFPHPRGVQK